MLKILRQRNFALLWFGGLISLTGDRVLSTALPFFIYQQTGSTLATGGMILATIIPRLLFGSVAGVYVDRWDRKQVMVAANLIRAVILMILLLTPQSLFTWFIYPIIFFETILSTFFEPAENALLPNLVSNDNLLTANSLNALNNTLARLIGPPLGGALLAIFGVHIVLTFDLLSYLIAGLLIFGIIQSPKQTVDEDDATPSNETAWGSWREGLRYIRRYHFIMAIMLVLGLITFAGTMLDPLIAPFVDDVLHGDAFVLGAMFTAQGLGGILSSLLIGRMSHRLQPTLLLGSSAILAGVLLLIVFNFPSVYIAIGLHFVLGLPLVGTRTSTQTLLQTHIPDAFRGRVYGTIGMVGAFLELISVSSASVMGDVIGIVPLLNIAAGLIIVAGIVALIMLPRQIDARINSSI